MATDSERMKLLGHRVRVDTTRADGDTGGEGTVVAVGPFDLAPFSGQRVGVLWDDDVSAQTYDLNEARWIMHSPECPACRTAVRVRP